jgi:hypothetical protein
MYKCPYKECNSEIHKLMFYDLKPLETTVGKIRYSPKCNIQNNWFSTTTKCSTINDKLLKLINDKTKNKGWDHIAIIDLIAKEIIPDYKILNKQNPPILAPEWLNYYVDKLNEYYQDKGQHLQIDNGIIKLNDPENNMPVPIPEPTFMPADNTVIDPIAPANTDNITNNPDTNVAPNPENKGDEVINLYKNLSREEQQNVIEKISAPAGGSRRKKRSRRTHSKKRRRKQSKRRQSKRRK